MIPRSRRRRTTRNIWVAPADGSEPARRLAASPRSDTHPRWSPDGRHLAFLSNRGDSGGDASAARNQIYLLSTSGGDAEQLPSVKGGVQDFRWSRDGKMIAFTSRDPDSEAEQKRRKEGFDEHFINHNHKPARLWVVTLADHQSEQITHQDLSFSGFDWSPDSAELVARVSAPPGAGETESHARLVVVRRSDGEVVRTLSDNVGGEILWSPDGQSVVFEERTPVGIASWLMVVPAAGGAARPLLKDYPGTPRAYEWESDSRHLVVEATWHTYQKFLRVELRMARLWNCPWKRRCRTRTSQSARMAGCSPMLGDGGFSRRRLGSRRGRDAQEAHRAECAGQRLAAGRREENQLEEQEGWPHLVRRTGDATGLQSRPALPDAGHVPRWSGGFVVVRLHQHSQRVGPDRRLARLCGLSAQSARIARAGMEV